jgi:hypothetical protein
MAQGGVCVQPPIPYVSQRTHAPIGARPTSSNPSQHVLRHKLYLGNYTSRFRSAIIPGKPPGLSSLSANVSLGDHYEWINKQSPSP